MRKVTKKFMLKVASFTAAAVLVPQLAMAVYVPDALKPWADWVLAPHKQATCAMVEHTKQKQCVTYGATSIDITIPKGAAFEMSVKVLADNTPVVLPGQTWAWPTSLTVDGQPKGATSVGNLPALRLDKGTYTITGSIDWENTPAYLQLPADLAQASIRLNGKPLDMPQMRGNRLVLQKSTIEPADDRNVPVAQNTSRVQVFRLITDQKPAIVTTELRLTITGAEREITIPNFHLPETEPAAYSGRVPAKRQKDGSYVLQVTAGVHNLTFTDRFTGGRLETLAMPDLPWGEEVWAFNPMPELRLVEAEGETPLNPDQTDMPGHWRNFAAYLMQPGESINFDIIREGAPTAPENALNLNRTMWLDQQGEQFTVRDVINGTMSNTWRLDMANNVTLGRVNLNGRPQPLTAGAGDRTGVELRQQYVNLEGIGTLGVSLLPFSAIKLPIGSWNTDFENASATLSMPAAWRPIGISGAPKTRGTWFSQWNLYQFFFLLLTTAIAFRMWGNAKWAAAAFLALALTMHDHASLLTMVLILLVCGMVLSALPKEANLYKGINRFRGLMIIFLVLFAVPFTLLHLQNAIYPHLAKEALFSFNLGADFNVRSVVSKTSPNMDDREIVSRRQMMKSAAQPPMAAPMAELDMAQSFGAARGAAGNALALQDTMAMEESIMPTVALDEFDPNTRVPTGPGLPEWRAKNNSVNLTWPEGVEQGETFRLWVLSPFGFRLLEILKVLVFGLLLAKLIKTDMPWPTVRGGKKVAAAALLTLGMFGATAPAFAQDAFPPEHLLNELERRLLEPAPCAPDCAFAEKVLIRARGDSLTFTFTYTAEDEVLAQLPKVTPVAFPSSISINGQPAFAVAQNNMPYVLLPKGRSVVEARYNAGEYNNLNVDLAQNIASFDSNLVGWRIGGLNSDGQPTSRRISLSRTPDRVAPQKQEDPKKSGFKPLEFAGYAKVTRNLEFNNTWTVTTTVQLEHGAPFTLDLPLLEGEKLLDTQYTLKDGAVRLQVGHRPVVLRSEIDPTESITLSAAKDDAYYEAWSIFASSKWHLEQTDGVAPIYHLQNGVWRPVWQPYAEDVVQLDIKRPAGVVGQELTIHSARVESTLRGKVKVNTLILNIETTRPQTHTISLGSSDTSTLKELAVNGRVISQKAVEDDATLEVGIPLRHGMNNARVVWEGEVSGLLHVSTPEVNLNAPFVNLTQTLSGLRDRWIVWSYGPASGPYVKLWAIVVGMVLLSWVMTKALPAPLGFAGWLILALGFTQAEPIAFLIPVGWIMLLQWRQAKGQRLSTLRFNALQVAIVALSLFVVAALFSVVKVGLLGTPEIYIEGNNSSPYLLQWYQDVGTDTPQDAGVCTLPMWLFRGIMMLWALWAALWLMRMFKWAWENFTAGGYWRKQDLTDKTNK